MVGTRAFEARQRAPTMPPRSSAIYAALDLGTNNCRLLIAKPRASGFHVVDAFSRVVRLGEGLAAAAPTPALSAPAVRRTVRALHVCAAKIRHNNVTHVRCVATEACRRAANASEFLEQVRNDTGLRLEVICSREEAQLAARGCTPLLDTAAQRALIFDIGGGSTELMWLARDQDGQFSLVDWASLGCGVLTMLEDYGGDRYASATYEHMIRRMETLIRPFVVDKLLADSVRAETIQVIGTSGTVTTLAGVNMGLRRYDRTVVDGATLSVDNIRRICQRLRRMDYADRARIPCIGRQRADLVVGGCAILEAVCQTFPVERIRVADRGVREGILYNLISRHERTAAPV